MCEKIPSSLLLLFAVGLCSFFASHTKPTLNLGVLDRLKPDNDVFVTDMSSSEAARLALLKCIESTNDLNRIGRNAQSKALAYGTHECCTQLHEMLAQSLLNQ